MIAVVALVGCGGEDEESNPEKGYVHHATVAGQIEWVVRKAAKKPTGELTKEDYEKVTRLSLQRRKLLKIPKELEKLTQLEFLMLKYNPALTQAQVDELQKALPKCFMVVTPTK